MTMNANANTAYINANSNNVNQEMNEGNGSINLIEEFMNTNEEENKLINSVKDEFTDLKFFNYGALIYLQSGDDLTNFPHVSELLENYEKLFSVNCFTGYFVLRLTKYYVTYNDGFLIFSDDGLDSMLNFFKIKNVVLMYNVRKEENNFGKINFRILKILQKLNFI